MLHHISLAVTDLSRSARLYDAALGALGYRQVCSTPSFIGYGLEEDKDRFALAAIEDPVDLPDRGFHIAFSAPSSEAVDAFYRAAMANGAEDNGEPGLRPHYGKGYYAAFVIDPDGYHLEAVINSRDP